ncbi:MAG TPA: ABC transporter permease, partial [bacterium]|nr:ABC transporter permease [bacterium]
MSTRRSTTAERPQPTGARALAAENALPTPGRSLWRRLRRHRLAVAGGTITLIMTAIAVASPVLLRADPTTIDVEHILAPPSPAHWLGTDDFGRDLLSRILHGARLSLSIGFSVLIVTVGLGGLSGMASGYFRVADAIVMRIMDALMAFPAILLALAVMAIAGPATINVVLALGIAYSPRMARLARAAVLTVRSRDFIEAA